jgi:hypothetical protein
MQRWSVAAMTVLFLAAVLFVSLGARAPRDPMTATGAQPGASAASAQATDLAGPPVTDAGTRKSDGGSADKEYDTLPDGGPVPALPAAAPSSVSFGVILFSYKGAQFAGPDAPDRARALERAKAALPEARKAFAEAVKKGDPGSVAEAGQIPRGILEPALEYMLFTLAEGTVYDEPIDTPRGYWILRRNK